jgi:hypothetical protein
MPTYSRKPIIIIAQSVDISSQEVKKITTLAQYPKNPPLSAFSAFQAQAHPQNAPAEELALVAPATS